MAIAPTVSTPEVQHKIQYRLTFARQQLLEESVPQRLRIMSYLRICYAAAQVYRATSLQKVPGLADQKPYIKLLNDLGACDPKWWEHCVISPRGYLRSQQLPIDQLLKPIREFVITHHSHVTA